MGLSSLAGSMDSLIPGSGKVIEAISSAITYADMAGNAFILLKGKLPAPFKALVKGILEANPVLKKAANFYMGITEGGFGFLNEKFGSSNQGEIYCSSNHSRNRIFRRMDKIQGDLDRAI